MSRRRRIEVLGVPVDVLSLDEACEAAASLWAAGGKHHVVTVNPELIMAARGSERGAALREALAGASLCVADGIGVVWASKVLGAPLPGRVPGIELAEGLIARAAAEGKSLFLLGGRPGVAEEAARRLERRFPGLRVAGTHHGYFDAEAPGGDEGVEAVAPFDVDLLLVGMGAPRQELWIARRKEQLRARVMIGVGGALDVFAGRVKRAPESLRRAGLEWAYRLATQPWRARRMTALPRFAAAVLEARWRGERA